MYIKISVQSFFPLDRVPRSYKTRANAPRRHSSPCRPLLLTSWHITYHTTSHTKQVSKEHGESFHLSPFPSLFHNSRQFSSSPFSYWKLFGSPAFQFVKVKGRPVDIQKKWPSSAKSVPEVQKCSLPNPAKGE